MLPLAPNVTVDIYRTANPSDPYTTGALSASGVQGYLKPLVATGRHGTALWLKWTHVLYLPPETDVRDAYNSQLDPARDDTLGDTILLADSADPLRATAYYVAFVEMANRGTTQQHLRAYLDRFAPNAWPNDAL